MFCLFLEYVASKPKHILPSLAQKVYPDPSPRRILLNVLKHSVVFHILQRAFWFLVITAAPQSFKILNTINSMTLTFQEHPHYFFFSLNIPKGGRGCDNLLLSCHTKHLPQCLVHSRCLINLS